MTSPTWQFMAVRASELLKDGRWHDYEDIAAELMPLVPPGQAFRRCELERGYWHTKTNEADTPIPPRRRPVSPEDLVKIGARSIVRDFLRTKAFEKQTVPQGTNKRTLIRMVHTPKRAVKREQRTLASARPDANPLGPWTVHNARQYAANRLVHQIITATLAALSDTAVAQVVGCSPRAVRALAGAARRVVSDVLVELEVGSEVYLQRGADSDDDDRDMEEELT